MQCEAYLHFHGTCEEALHFYQSIFGGEIAGSALSADGQVTMPFEDTFWGARFGMLIDKYGIEWMVNCDTAGS